MVKQAKKKNQDFFQVYGINGVSNVIQAKKINIVRIDIMVGGMAEKKPWVINLSYNKSLSIRHIPKAQFLRQYPGKRTQGIVVTFTGEIIRDILLLEKGADNFCLLALDNVEDPQNLGQIIRTAECAGMDGIIIPKHDSCAMTDTVIQVSQGAFTQIPVYQINNLHQTVTNLKNEEFWVIAMENGIKAKDWYKIDYSGKMLVIVGSEGRGIKKLVLESSDFQATIPMQGKTSSLNVSAAVSAVLFERLRQLSA